ncbi:MAG: TM0106 family RecB-like putative nuclease [Gammaproteobacteria bacterium]|nr:TM0106 family RecB-like putative nuclease [Gammaproteobacteria bacterium]
MKQHSEQITLAPTDLSNFLGCRHLLALDLKAAQGDLERPVRSDALLAELRERGLKHEEAYLEQLKSEGLDIVGFDIVGSDGIEDHKKHLATLAETTLAAMREGADVIYQAVLTGGAWSGRADFLRKKVHKKANSPSKFGDWSYEPYDTKLARETRAGTILQLCVYSSLLGKVQGTQPEYMHVVTPGNDFRPQSYRVDEYAAYFRLLQQEINKFVLRPEETYPEKVSHCDYCSWWSQCEARRRQDDHLCYVSGITTTQIKSLRTLGVERLSQLADLNPVPRPDQGSHEALMRIREQARVQHIARRDNFPRYELKKPLDAEHGLALLPEPTPDDIFLDFEGNHFAETGVQEYLIGYLVNRPDNSGGYTALWAKKHEEERAAFEQFIDFATEVRKQNPRAHIYHFAPYEPAALKRLMGRYATREVELDELLRADAFVDLHKVVKRALVAGVERYSIKDLEPYFDYARKQDVRTATMSRRVIENAITSGDSQEVPDAHFEMVECYNREDCESAVRLRDWLEQLRDNITSDGQILPRPELKTGEASEEISETDSALERLRNSLLEGIPINPDERSAEQQACFVLAHMMEFHRREDKASWWEYFRLLGLDASELVDERRAVTGLHHECTLEPKAAPLERYRFQPQELDVRKGDDVHSSGGNIVGKVQDVNYSQHTIDIKKRGAAADEHPNAVVLHSRIPSDVLRKSLMRFAEAVLVNGFDLGIPYRAAVKLLLRQPPPATGPNGALKQPEEDTTAAARRIALALDGDVLAIQGPPGTGKTYTGALIICELVRAGLTVGVTAVSHKVIVNLLEASASATHKDGLPISIVHRQQGEYKGNCGIRYENNYSAILDDLNNGQINVLGATAWGWSKPEFEQAVDVLVVDEAGQMSLANVLACAPAARNLVLLGDPQQLEQPLQSSHPEGSDVSALYHLSEGEDTMPAHRGLFLFETYRLHPDIAKFTSEIYYEDKIKSRPGLERQKILSDSDDKSHLTGAGLRFLPVSHKGNQARCQEEVEVIGQVIEMLLKHYDWQDQEDEVRSLTVDDILVVAPYNAQVSALSEALPELAERIGTVDRFQGQEAPVVIYSMTSSSPEDAPRGMEFLYNSFRFNVATSRARALCILVGSPLLFRPECRTPQQMKMANGFCRYMELALKLQLPALR